MQEAATISPEAHSDSDSDMVEGDDLVKASDVVGSFSPSDVQKNPSKWPSIIADLRHANWSNFSEYPESNIIVLLASLDGILQELCTTLENPNNSTATNKLNLVVAPATVLALLLSHSNLKSTGACIDTLINFTIAFARSTSSSSASQSSRCLFEGIHSVSEVYLCDTHAERLLPVLLREIFSGCSQAIPCLSTLEILMRKFTRELSHSIGEELTQRIAKCPAPTEGRGPSTAITADGEVHLSPLSSILLSVAGAVCRDRGGFILMTDMLNDIIQGMLSLCLSETFTKEKQDRVRVEAILSRLVSDVCDIASDLNHAAASVVCSVLLKCIVKYAVSSNGGSKSYQSTVAKNIAIVAMERFGKLLLSNRPPVDKGQYSISDYLRSAKCLELDTSSIDVIKYSVQASSIPEVDQNAIEPESETEKLSKSAAWRICREFQLSFTCSIFTQKVTTLVGILVGILIEASSSVASRRAALRVVSSLIKSEPQPGQLLAYAGMLLRKALSQSSPVIRELGLDLVPVIRATCTGPTSTNMIAVKELLQLLAREKSATVVRKVLSLLTEAVLESDSQVRVFILSKIFTALAPLLDSVETTTENRLRSDVQLLLGKIWNFAPVTSSDCSTGRSKRSKAKAELVAFRDKKQSNAGKRVNEESNRRILTELASLLVLGMQSSAEAGVSETVVSVLKSSATEQDLRSLLSVAQTSPPESSNKASIVIHALCRANPNIVASFNDCVLFGQLLGRAATEPNVHHQVLLHIASSISICCQEGTLLTSVGQPTLIEHLMNPLLTLHCQCRSQMELSAVLTALCFLCKIPKKNDIVEKTTQIMTSSLQVASDLLNLNADSECSDSSSASSSSSSSRKKKNALAPKYVAVNQSIFKISEIVRHFPMMMNHDLLVSKGCSLQEIFSFSQKLLDRSSKLPVSTNALTIHLVMSIVCQHPVKYLRSFRQLLQETIRDGGSSAVQVLQGFCHFLKEEVRICAATASAHAGGANDDEPTQMVTGLGAEIVQLYTSLIIELCVATPDSSVKRLAVEFISVAASQGLCSPIVLSEVLVALTGGVDRCQSAESQLTRLAKRHPKEVLIKFASGVRVGYQLSLNSSGKPASDLHGYVGDTFTCSYSVVFKTMQQNVHTQDMINSTKQLLKTLTSPIHLSAVSTALDGNVFNVVHCLRFVTEVLVHLPYIKMREPLSLLRDVNEEVSLRAETLLESTTRTKDEWILLCGLYLCHCLKSALKLKYSITNNSIERFTELQLTKGKRAGTQQGVPVVDSCHRNFYKAMDQFTRSVDICRNCNTKSEKITKVLWDRMAGKLETAINRDMKINMSFEKGKRKTSTRTRKRRKRANSSSSSDSSGSSSSSSGSSTSSESSSNTGSESSDDEQVLYQQAKARRSGVLQTKGTGSKGPKKDAEIVQRTDVENLASLSSDSNSDDDSDGSSSS
eukprot:TRINITY_DN3945_c1_g1_i1.p1 TRINITY_DN3945_c1_g1~~TRINITY_DN3945_c1_g1_i1.p1  ORF type:complete len:1642 (+),score=301.58 TRINITY_DN3945_c1_g1_i1:622-4926(+)